VFAVSGRLGLFPKYFGLFNVCYYFVILGLEIATERQALERWEQGANASLPMGAPCSQHALSRNWEQRKARAHYHLFKRYLVNNVLTVNNWEF
jgi:hypothetical protein